MMGQTPGLPDSNGTSKPRSYRPVDFHNSSRVHDLIRAGNLYLSQADALALAIENNLDVELNRFSFQIADTDVTRSKGGGLLRGVPFLVTEAPTGVGGPLSPVVTNPASSTSVTTGTTVSTNAIELGALGEPQTNLSIQGTIPQSSGTPIPIFDPSVVGQLTWTASDYARRLTFSRTARPHW